MPASICSKVFGRSLVVCVALAWPGASGAAQAATQGWGLPPVQLSPTNAVPACVTPKRLTAFTRSRNSRLAPRYQRLAGHYATYGARIGVRWDIGYFQMMVETSNLTFQRPDGSPGDVLPEHNNFAGIGAIGDGRPGEVFATQIQGVRAHLEHVLHYSGAFVRAPVAERTRRVQKWRVLASWHKAFDRPVTYGDLARRWAPHTGAYLASIEQLALAFQRRYCEGGQPLMVEVGRRQPVIAKTAWRFERLDGKPGTAGVTPPTGRPNFGERRGGLGAGAIAKAASTPPLPELQPRLSASLAAPKTVIQSPKAVRMAAVALTQREKPRQEPAKPPQISEEDRIRQMVSDRKILLRTHVGTIMPIVFNGNGEMTGHAGSLAFFLGSSRDKGRWWVAKGKLCHKWRVWLDRETLCMKLKEQGDTIWWQADDGKRGTARIVSK